MRMLQKQIWGWLVPVGTVVAMLIIFRFIFLFGYVPTESMEPALERDSYIMGCRIYDELEAGDILIFRSDGKLLVKRIAVVGDMQVEHNGTSLTVPEKCYYVLGDNVEYSYDSRYWEEPFAGKEDIVAKLIGD